MLYNKAHSRSKHALFRLQIMPLSQITQIEKLLNIEEIAFYHSLLSRPIVTKIVKAEVNRYRQQIIENNASVNHAELVKNIVSCLANYSIIRTQPVINATGIVVHTNLGRSPLSHNVWQEASKIVCRYSNLELNLSNGKRGNRMGMLSEVLSCYFGGEANIVVNNNAAAVHLILKALANGKEVIVSRGEQVQIGGGFRIPEILAESGAILRDVGTTNITTIDDYLNAINENTAMVLIVHQSNYYIEGFTQQVNIKQLAARLPKHIMLVVDQGSGNQLNSIANEPTVANYLAAGADLVCLSGDKMVGGPQSGIILGKKPLIDQLAKHPMMRVFRPGKETYILLEKLLIARLNQRDDAISAIEKLIAKPQQWHKDRAQQFVDINPDKLQLQQTTFLIGGGTTPKAQYDTYAIALNSQYSPSTLITRLRQYSPAIIGVIQQNKVLIYPVTLFDDELIIVKNCLMQLLNDPHF